jgi:glycosyltransferase involved in cell wall biosynthesis
MTRVLFFGTHPNCFNGYCLITYNLAKELAKRKDIELSIYGFQNFYAHGEHMKERELPPNVYIYDAFANENPKQMGFGFDQVTDFVTINKPDVCIVYNDMVVVSNVLNKLKEVKNKNFKIIVYIDQVYLYQKQEYVAKLNEEADYVLCFTPYWESIARDIGITKPTGYLQHGFDKMVNYPVPKELARQHFGLKKEDFIILNLNRNQPRKRWDICLQAFAEVVSRHIEEPIKLLIATSLNGAWNLMEVYERELKKRGLTLEDGRKHIILIDNPQQLTDEDINILYNVADIGINTCDGEGFGLCNFQQAAIGIPQIVPYIGGFKDFFDKEKACIIEPKYTLYIETSRDGVGGESELCDWRDFAESLDYLYCNPEECKNIGTNARKHILENYKWSDLADKCYKIIKEVHGVKEEPAVSSVSLKMIQEWEKELKIDDVSKENLNIETLSKSTNVDEPVTPPTPVPEKPSKSKSKKNKSTEKVETSHSKRKEETKERLRSKLKKKNDLNIDKETLVALKEKLDKLLA